MHDFLGPLVPENSPEYQKVYFLSVFHTALNVND